jgi:hypothetical protein
MRPTRETSRSWLLRESAQECRSVLPALGIFPVLKTSNQALALFHMEVDMRFVRFSLVTAFVLCVLSASQGRAPAAPDAGPPDPPQTVQWSQPRVLPSGALQHSRSGA